MEFSVGDKVVHPKYGPGKITSVEHRELVEGFEHYFVLKMVGNDSTLYIPMSKMDELGVRPVMSEARLVRVLDTLRDVPHRLSKDFRKRQERIREKLATARPLKVAEAIRDLTWRRERSHLTKVDNDLLTQGRDLLAAEMAAVTDTEVVDAHEIMDSVLDGALAREDEEAEEESEDAQLSDLTPTKSKTLLRRLLRRVRGNGGASSVGEKVSSQTPIVGYQQA